MEHDDDDSKVLLSFFGGALVVSVWFLWVYAERTMNPFVILTSVLAFTVGLCTVPLVPYDLWVTQVRVHKLENSEEMLISPERVHAGLLACWHALYWFTALLCYLFIPFVSEFETAGDFRFKARCRTSLRRNLAWYIAYIVLGILLLIFLPSEWVIEEGTQQGKLVSFAGFCIAASNTFGLLLLTLLMGFGLVRLPRNLWLAADNAERLRSLYARVTGQNTVRLAAQSELQEVLAEVENEMRATTDRLNDNNEQNPFENKAPLRAAVGILQKTVHNSQEFLKHMDATCPRQARVPETQSFLPSSQSSSSSSSPSFTGNAVAESSRLAAFKGVFKKLRPDRGSEGTSNTIEGRRSQIRKRREEMESVNLTGLVTPLTEASGNHGSDESIDAAVSGPGDPLRRQVSSGSEGSGLRDEMKRLASLHSALKFVTLEARRATHEWDTLVHSCFVMEDLDNLETETRTDMPGSKWSIRRQVYEASWSYTRSSPLCCSSCCQDALRKSHVLRGVWRRSVTFWFRTARPYLLKCASLITAVLSGCIILGQLTMFSKSLWFCSIFGVLVHYFTNAGFWSTHIVCLVPLGYMVLTACWGVFKLRIAGWYGLYPKCNTDASSLLWVASLVTKLSVPLCYHFLTLLRCSDYDEKTSFEEFMQPMQIVPVLGKDFNRYFPMFVFVLAVCNIAGVYSGMVKKLGMSWLESFLYMEDEEAPTHDKEGKELIGIERRRRFEDSIRELQRNGEAMDVPERASSGTSLQTPTIAESAE
jgi:hypothetical protein